MPDEPLQLTRVYHFVSLLFCFPKYFHTGTLVGTTSPPAGLENNSLWIINVPDSVGPFQQITTFRICTNDSFALSFAKTCPPLPLEALSANPSRAPTPEPTQILPRIPHRIRRLSRQSSQARNRVQRPLRHLRVSPPHHLRKTLQDPRSSRPLSLRLECRAPSQRLPSV
jgi:hypothetical protein